MSIRCLDGMLAAIAALMRHNNLDSLHIPPEDFADHSTVEAVREQVLKSRENRHQSSWAFSAKAHKAAGGTGEQCPPAVLTTVDLQVLDKSIMAAFPRLKRRADGEEDSGYFSEDGGYESEDDEAGGNAGDGDESWHGGSASDTGSSDNEGSGDESESEDSDGRSDNSGDEESHDSGDDSNNSDEWSGVDEEGGDARGGRKRRAARERHASGAPSAAKRRADASAKSNASEPASRRTRSSKR